MRPTLRQFQYLVALADLGSFKEAAKRMNISQPSLSTQLQDMEIELKTKLVERGRNGSFLTRAGEVVAHRARELLQGVDDLKTQIRRKPGTLSGRVRLGVIPSIGPYLLPEVTGKLHAMYPALRLSIHDQRMVLLDELLQNGKVDALISTPEDHPQTISRNLFREDMWICVADDSPLAHQTGPLKINQLKGHELLSIGAGNQLSKAIEKIARLSGASINAEYEGNGLDATRIMAAMGSGVAVLPSLYALLEARRDPELHIRKIDDPRVGRTISLIWRSTSPLGEDYNILADTIGHAANELIARATHLMFPKHSV